MTLYETIDLLKKIALKHPNIGSASEGNIYEYMNANPSVKYGVFFITQGTHSQDEMFNHFEFTLFYVDRLVDDMEDNRLQIQSIGKEILSNILTFFCEEFDAECENISFQPFTQRFVDETAGIYCTITIDMPKDIICPEEYWKEDWVAPVTVIRNQDKRVTFTENGTYTIDYDPTTYTGLGNVEVNVNIDVDSYYNNGYNQGKTDGVNEQKSKLESINITENGTYTKEDGYSEVVVNVPDLNGSYDEGYQQGHTEGYAEGERIGYNQGKTDGVNEQKSKLESISIIENGTYNKEDGYNHIEVNVPSYEQGQADMAAKARILNVTKNGTYLSKFSDPIAPATVTGVYADGTKFYSYAELGNKVYNTNITVTQDSVVELWYKGDNAYTDNGWNTIFGCTKKEDEDFWMGYWSYDNTNLSACLGQIRIRFSWDDNVWHHILMKNDGLWIDDALIGSFNTTKTFAYKLGLNSDGGSFIRHANGCYGMIKIDDIVIIPTADGFLNTNTGELLEVVKDGGYVFAENLPIYAEGELYKTINVNVPDLNGSYDEGYGQGKTDGVNEQKSKLESINITANGTYSKEDGYNHIEVNVPDLNGSYDEGYAQGHTEGYNEGKTDGVNEQKGKLSQITISENGTYANENGYSEVVVNVPDLNGSYDEGYAQGKTDGINEQKGKLVSINITENGTYTKEDGYNQIEVNVPDLNGSYDEGYAQGKTDGVNEQKSKLETINITKNGTYTKEDGYNEIVVEVPDLNGSYDEGYTQGQADAVANAKALEVTENGQYGDGKTLYKTINVNVNPKINVEETGLRFGNSTFTEVPEWADFKGVTDMYGMFQYCSNLQRIPLIDTSNVSSMSNTFAYCGDLQTIPSLDTSKVTNMYNMFYYCGGLQTIPLLNTSNVSNMDYMFSYCNRLQTIPSLDTSKVTTMSNMFNDCRSLVSLPALNAQSLNMQSYYGVFGSNELPNLTDFGGFLNLKCSLTNDKNLKKLPNLTYESCINVLNGLYDFTGNGQTPNSNQGHLKVHANFLTTVGDEISIGTLKGWTITSN